MARRCSQVSSAPKSSACVTQDRLSIVKSTIPYGRTDDPIVLFSPPKDSSNVLNDFGD